MAEATGDRSEVDAGAEELRGHEVSEVVEAHLPHAEAVAKPAELQAHEVRPPRARAPGGRGRRAPLRLRRARRQPGLRQPRPAAGGPPAHVPPRGRGPVRQRRTCRRPLEPPNVHGDVMAGSDATGAKVGAISTYDPFGSPLTPRPDNEVGQFDYGWLGSHQRPWSTRGSLTPSKMGAPPSASALVDAGVAAARSSGGSISRPSADHTPCDQLAGRVVTRRS